MTALVQSALVQSAVWRELAECCRGAEIVCPEAIAPPLERALEVLAAFNARTNLVGDATLRGALFDHVLESLVLATALAEVAPEPRTVLDVGAGAGLEALVLSLLWPSAQVTAIEPRRKRGDFIEVMADRAGAGSRLHVLREPFGPRYAGPRFDLTVSRATFSPSQWPELAARATLPGGWIAAHGHRSPTTSAHPRQPQHERAVPGSTRAILLFSHAPTQTGATERGG